MPTNALFLNITDEGYELTAVVDDDGFFWLDTLSGNRFTSEQFSIIAMDELGELLTGYLD
jgi:hypothetical protein